MARTHHLTERQRRFAEAYVELGNALKAAEKAGFQPAYANNVKRQPAVVEYMNELRSKIPVGHTEVINFLVGVMRGNIKADQLRTEAAYQVGKRAGLWKDHVQYEKKLKEAMTNE